jgi:hypothetical protein
MLYAALQQGYCIPFPQDVQQFLNACSAGWKCPSACRSVLDLLTDANVY